MKYKKHKGHYRGKFERIHRECPTDCYSCNECRYYFGHCVNYFVYFRNYHSIIHYCINKYDNPFIF